MIWWGWGRRSQAQRGSARQTLSLVTTMRGPHGQRGSILIRDISEEGFKAECMIRFRKGAEVVVDLPGGRAVEARVEWSRRDSVGVSFKEPVALGILLGV